MAFLQKRSCENVGDEESAICTVSVGPHSRFSPGGGSLMRLKCNISILLRSMKSTTKMLLQKVIEGTLFSYSALYCYSFDQYDYVGYIKEFAEILIIQIVIKCICK